jgi:hypothetical protein
MGDESEPVKLRASPQPALHRVVGWFLSRFVDRLVVNAVRRFVMICKRQPTIPHPHQDGPDLGMGFGLCETETTICLLCEVQMLRHRIPRRQVANRSVPPLLVVRRGEIMLVNGILTATSWLASPGVRDAKV